MSLDALRLVSEYMTPAGRINLAQIDAPTCDVLSRWEDVHSLLFDETKVLMAGEVFRHRIDCTADVEHGLKLPLDQSFTLCPHARHVWIQTRLRNEHIPSIQKRSAVIESLFISSENFDTRYPLNWDQVSLKRLRSINILHRMDQPLNLKQIVDPKACKALFPISLRSVNMTGVVISSVLMDTLLTLSNLRHLDLMGCVIDTNLAAQYVEKLGRLSNLDELSIPPSMFSFSTREQNKVTFTMRKLRLSKLAIYMEQFDENTFFEQLETMMPRKLEVLVLYGNFFALKKSKKYSQWKKFEILFGSMTPQVRTQWWMRDDALLMSHLVRSAPYKVAEDFRPVRNTAASWRFDQAAVDNEEARLERINQPVNRILRFMRPEAQPAPAIQQHAVPEAPPPPPPPPPLRRDRVRRRSNIPAVAEEQNAAPPILPNPMPLMLTLPPDGAESAPIGIILPVAPPPPAPPAPGSNQQHGVVMEFSPPPRHPTGAASQPPATNLPTAASNVDPQSQASAARTLPGATQASFPPNVNRPENANQTVQIVNVQEVSADTPAAPHQPQPTIQSPQELRAAGTQPGSPDGEMRTTPPIRPPRSTTAPQQNRHDEQPDMHPDEENINMMLQGMLQALVEEIVFDAMNEERMENPATDPSPAVSSNTTRSTAANNSIMRTPTPVTPPPTEMPQAQRARNAPDDRNH
ncbi:hypothetical protein Q1695_010652 [Nippostrongylus brasiliensis]|nr:hypothetical protein Q1695_010652 [Nippostrongylus brasiliensis]